MADCGSSHRPLGTTFKGKYGCVDYWVKAFLERPSFPTQEIKKRFEVMDPVDVNTPELLVSVGTTPLGLLFGVEVTPGVGRDRRTSGIKAPVRGLGAEPGLKCLGSSGCFVFLRGNLGGEEGRRKCGWGGSCWSLLWANAVLSPQSPVAAKKEKKVSCMFIPDGRVSVSAQIDRKGFCEGKGRAWPLLLGGGHALVGWR